MNRSTRLFQLFAAFFLTAGFLIGPAFSEDAALREDFKKLLDSRQETFLAEIMKLIDQRVEERLAKLEEAVKSRDKTIADLKAQVAQLSTSSDAPTPAPAPAVGVPRQALLGVWHTDVAADLRSKYNVEGGALVTRVLTKTPATDAGIQVGDIIIAVNGEAVTSANLIGKIDGLKPDQEIEVTYIHGGSKVTKKAKLIDRAAYYAALEARPVRLGVTVHEIDGKLVVENVEAGFTGSVAGLAENDVITSINGKKVTTIPEIEEVLGKIHAGDQFRLGFQRGGEATTLEVVGSDGPQGAKLIPRKPDVKKRGVLGVSVVLSVAGVEVESVDTDSAAAAGGVQKGDIVKQLNGKDVADIAQLRGLLLKLAVGDKVALVVARGDESVELKDIMLKAMGPPESVAPVAAKPAPKPAPQRKGKLGFMASQAEGPSLVIKSVDPGSPAEKGELQVADVILSVNGKEVKSFSDLESVLKPASAGDALAMRVRRGAEEKDLTITLE